MLFLAVRIVFQAVFFRSASGHRGPCFRGVEIVAGEHSGIEVKASPVHGKGVYALRRFRRGSYIGTFRGVETQEDGTHVLWVTDEQGRQTGVEGRNELRFLNHDPEPNAEFIGLDLFALRNIQPGREIMIDYGEEWRE